MDIKEYMKLAQEALDEPDPERSLELCQKAVEMGRRLGFFAGGIGQGDGRGETIDNGRIEK